MPVKICQICHTEPGLRTGLTTCKTCKKRFCVDCGSHEECICCECLREDDTLHNVDFHVGDAATEDILEALDHADA